MTQTKQDSREPVLLMALKIRNVSFCVLASRKDMQGTV
jgi:hypothetical protein